MRIAVVGVDGAGKSTQVQLLQAKLAEWGTVRVCKAESGNRSLVEQMKLEYTLFKKLLSIAMALDLAQAVRTVGEDADFLLWDRYTYCVQAYFAAENISNEYANVILAHLPKPDLVIWIDADPAIAARRVRMRGEAKPLENELFMGKVREAYLRILRHESNVLVFDGNREQQTVHMDIMGAVIPLLEKAP